MENTRIILEEFQISQEYKGASSKKSKKQKKSPPCSVKIINMNDENLELDFIGYHTSLINAFRRIILAEVPTMAIEKIYMYNNTSIVQDEVLSHRLGLIPLGVNPRFFEFHNTDADWGPQDTVKYEMKLRCTKNPNADPATTNNLDHLYKNRKIFSCSLKWVPIGNQKDIFKEDSMQPLHDDILIAKMNPGHEINLEAFAVKGIGSDHAKFQPGLCWYRLLPEVQLTRDVIGPEAHQLKNCFSPGVISVFTNKEGKPQAKVEDARDDSCSRNVFQNENLKDAVLLTRKLDHIIFHVEAHGALKSHEILTEAVEIMIKRCDTLLDILSKVGEDDY